MPDQWRVCNKAHFLIFPDESEKQEEGPKFYFDQHANNLIFAPCSYCWICKSCYVYFPIIESTTITVIGLARVNFNQVKDC